MSCEIKEVPSCDQQLSLDSASASTAAEITEESLRNDVYPAAAHGNYVKALHFNHSHTHLELHKPGRAPFRFSYDVFLSFRGPDTRYGFTGWLFHKLKEMGIRTFFDDREIQKGRQVTQELPKGIEKSRIFIIVFSENYAHSSFCLDELVKIMDERTKRNGRLVLLVFYCMDHSQLQNPHPESSYGKALAKHEERFKRDPQNLVKNMERLEKWKKALHEAADIDGWDVKERDSNAEFDFEWISLIVKEVSRHVAASPIGIKTRMDKVNSLLSVGYDNEVHMVGMCGIDGIGKTTVARAVYDFINADDFNASCFLDNVKEISSKHGLVHLQKILLSKMVELKDIEIRYVDEGKHIIKSMLHQKKVFLILDGVDQLEQLQATVGQTDWFGPGSRVIIITQQQGLLEHHGIKEESIYNVDKLNDTEAFELLTSKACKDGKVDTGYMKIFNGTIACASRNPLDLEIRGSHLCGKSIKDCESILNQYQQIPGNEIQEILKISFHALEKAQQDILINIASHSEDQESEKVEAECQRISDGKLKDDIRVLVDESLIKIEHGQVTLHDLTRRTVREIVKQDPGKY